MFSQCYHTINPSYHVRYIPERVRSSNDFRFLLSRIISAKPASYITKPWMPCLMTLSAWGAEDLWIIRVVHLKCLTKFLHSLSKGSICGPHGPAAGLSHAPSTQAAQARGSSHNPSPCLLSQAAILSSQLSFYAFCLFAWLPARMDPERGKAAMYRHPLNPQPAHVTSAPAAQTFGGQHAPA